MTLLKDLNAARAELRRAVAELIDPTPVRGGIMMPLIEQLREAGAGSTSGRGGGSSRTGSPMPIDPEAVELYAALDRQARTELWRVESIAHVGTTMAEHVRVDLPPETRIRRCAAFVARHGSAPDHIEWLTTLLHQWAERIRDHLDPAVRWAISEPCPVCGVKWVTKEDSTGEMVRTLTLVATAHRGAACLSCGKAWCTAADMEDMAKMIEQAEQDAADRAAADRAGQDRHAEVT